MKHLLFILTLTLFSCSKGYKKINEKWAYVSFDEAVGKRAKYLDADNETFKILKNTDYATDRKSVYLIGKKIENADPNSFIVMKNGYSADKSNVFLDFETVIEADPKTFMLLDFPYAKDNKKLYCGTLPLLTSDINEFVVMESGTMKTTELTTSFIKFNPQYNWIDTLKYKSVVYGQGIGKTKKEKFAGYIKK